ncbi:hypothetical protein [Leptospira sp. GIMC2001]|uniref:hypothetical protein n=1 Tax=Leptospira sp. GIMC2001 TaxID=1513297 RepID=UPI00234BED60|nr:hypothetical protein [Leptospira sp. GIMC2001]WCL48922.1 hypothetical protein O4O04_16735 [Leptospira sp. GIMC2001]
MADKASKFNEDEFSDMEPVLDEDSFSFEMEGEDASIAKNNELIDPGMEPPDLNEIGASESEEVLLDADDDFGLDSMVASSGDDYPVEGDSLGMDLDSELDLIGEEFVVEDHLSHDSESTDFEDIDFNINDSDSSGDSFENFGDTDSSAKTSHEDTVLEDFDGFDTESDSKIENDSDTEIELDLDEDDPLIDEKIDEIVNENLTSENDSSFNDDDLTFGESDEEDEPITLSIDELDNITGNDSNDLEDEDFADINETSENIDPNDDSTGTTVFSDDELDQILGTDIFDEDEREASMVGLESDHDHLVPNEEKETESTSLLDENEDLSDEPIALSMDELENIMASEEEDSDTNEYHVVDSDDNELGLDLDINNAPQTSFNDDLDFDGVLDSDPPSATDLFSEEDAAEEPITLSLDELENIAAFEESDEEKHSPSTMEFGDNDDFTIDESSLESEQEANSNLLESDEDLFGEEDAADEPITLSMDELANITTADSEEDSKDDFDFGDSDSSLDDGLFDSEEKKSEEDIFSDKPIDELDSDIFSDEPLESLDSKLTTADDDESGLGFAWDDTLPEDSNDISFDSEKDENKDKDKDKDKDAIDTTDTDEIINGLEIKDEEADEPITLSLDELSAITGDEEDAESTHDDDSLATNFDPMGDEDEFDLAGLPEPDDTVDFEEFTLEDADVSSEDIDLLSEPSDANDSTEIKADAEEEDNLTLSDEELGNILGAEDELPAIAGFEEIEPLESSEDSLDNPETSKAASGSGFGEDDFGLDLIPVEDEITLIDDEDEAESPIVSSDSDEFSADEFSLDDTSADEPITLSNEELTNILGDLPPGEDLEVQDQIVEETPDVSDDSEFDMVATDLDSSDSQFSDSSDLDFSQDDSSTKFSSLDLDQEDDIEVIDMDEYAEDGSLSPLEELRATPAAESDNKIEESRITDEETSSENAKDQLSIEEKKKVLAYLDGMLGNLPDDLIREFSKSNYFDLYKKLMKEIGL